MYNDLVSATVQTSADMSTKLVVIQDKVPVKVLADRLSLLIEQNDGGMFITLPMDKTQRMQCMRGQLPGRLAEILNIYDSRGEKQLYRILNEIESGTDAILLQEEISPVSWLPETCRPDPPQPAEDSVSALQQRPAHIVNGQPGDDHLDPANTDELESPLRAMSSVAPNTYPYRQSAPFRALPAVLDHASEAPLYWKVLEHVRRQAASFGHVNGRGLHIDPDDIAQAFASLSLEGVHLDPADYPKLFGHDVWLSKFRVGAAGELFVSVTTLICEGSC